MKRHPTDGVSLTFAILFLLVAAWWTVARSLDLPLPAVGWFVAGGLILFGILGLLGALRSARAGADPAPPVASAPPGSPANAAPPGDPDRG